MTPTATNDLILAVDASILVGELTRLRGHQLVAHPRLRLRITQEALSETLHELPRRLQARERHQQLGDGWAAQMEVRCLALMRRSVRPAPAATYARWEAAVRRRVPRDPNDWPTVALALELECGIWTADADFLGCGVPTWTTETLGLHLTT
jgi:predicted nucleic acid-binding protein